ncbi:MAG: sugar phosphate isomerase/epimerase [Ruminococcaceae bacterium]|nr:sugar phosphate isomerase/epimerase [Oscillospiraceae bacterium]
MDRKLYISTGTLVGRDNGYDYRGALGEIRSLCDGGYADGLELMMLRFYYDKTDAVVDAVRNCGVVPATIHCEKDVGTFISDAAVLDLDGKHDEAEKMYLDAKKLFEINCDVAEKLGIERMVLHLWGGYSSDKNIGYNIEKYSELSELAEKKGVRILVENIPSNLMDPLTNWRTLLPHLKNGGLVFDTRFGKLHEQTEDIFSDKEITDKIEHIHISDFGGEFREFSALRPILHPGEGKIDFFHVAALLEGIGYKGSITLESPVMVGAEWNIPKLKDTLSFIRDNF